MTAGTSSTGEAEQQPSAPGPGTLPEPQVRDMFDRIARVYDRMNAVMTAGLHQAWRRRAAELAALQPGDRALDLSGGRLDGMSLESETA